MTTLPPIVPPVLPPATTTLGVILSVNRSEGRGRVKARNGRYVDGDTYHVTYSLRATLQPSNTKVVPTYDLRIRDSITISRPYKQHGEWTISCIEAAQFQSWVITFGQPAVEMVRAALDKGGFLSLFRGAAKEGSRFW